jgi:hypothetical protein
MSFESCLQRERPNRTLPFRRLTRALASVTALLAIGAFSVLGCDFGSLSSAPPETCTEAGVQCALAAGPLGVCERSSCAVGATAPCFQCTPQH